MTKTNRHPASRGKSWGALELLLTFPLGPVLVKSCLCAKLGLSHVYPCLAEAATNCGSLCSSKQVAQDQSQAASDIDLCYSPSLEAQNQHSQGHVSLTSEEDAINSTSATSEGRSQGSY